MDSEVEDDPDRLISSESECDRSEFTQKTKKRKKTGRLSDVSKRIRNQSLTTGEPCYCKRFKCFEVTSDEERKKIINELNLLPSYDAQNAHLSGLISIYEVVRHRPRLNPAEAGKKDFSYTYKVRVEREGKFIEIPVCHKGFMSIYGITNRRTITLKHALAYKGHAPVDGRGKHDSRPHKIKPETFSKVCDHIKSFKSRKAHYSLHDSSKTYLDEDLNIKKMHDLYIQDNPQFKVSYEKYREIFNNHFNISFGYPRTDTCSQCDEYKAKIRQIELEISQLQMSDKTEEQLNQNKKNLEVANNLHLKKAEKFYEIKRKARKNSKRTPEVMCIAMDFQKNLPIPNLSTNDVYYKRQLSFYIFNIHELPSKKSYFFTYDETVAKKGSNEVTSMLHHYLTHLMNPEVRHLKIFCDSCGGQNKNYCVLKYLYAAVHFLNLLDSVTVVYPIRGHSYLECDKNMALINMKAPCELPEDWRDEIRKARTKPEPFQVVNCTQDGMFYSWNEHLKRYFAKDCPFFTRPIRVLQVSKETPGVFLHRDSFSGGFIPSEIFGTKEKKGKKKQKKVAKTPPPYEGFPQLMYNKPIPISAEKLKDLNHLKRFCGPAGKSFIENLNIATEESGKSGTDSEDE